MSRVKRSLFLVDFYRMYKARCYEKGIDAKPRKEYEKIIRTMGAVMSDMLLEDGVIAIPWRLGDVFFKQKEKGKVNIPSFCTENGKKIRRTEFNDHTDGITFKVSWLSPEREQKKQKAWCFSLYRGTKRKGVKLMKKGKIYPDYKMMNKRA